MMKNTLSLCSGLLSVLAGTLAPTSASAHNFKPHDAIVRASTSALHFWLEDPNPDNFCPLSDELPTLEPAFQNYMDQATAALTNLRKLRTGLLPVESDTKRCNQTTLSDGEVIGYYPEDNLDRMPLFRIADFRYLVKRGYRDPCNLVGLHDSPDSNPANDRLTNEGWRTLGSVLGNHAGAVDLRDRDTVLWLKPLNGSYWGLMKDGLSIFAAAAGAALLVPFACLWSLFSDSAECSDARHWAVAYNPVDYAAGLIPGVPYSFTGGDIFDGTGVWHFQQSDEGAWWSYANDPSGLYYPFAGPEGSGRGVMDQFIQGAAGVTGVSLHALESLGVRDFGQFDEADRSWPLWEAHSIGFTEFTPVSKLAKYGVKEYSDGGYTTAERLGYPLHAFADAVFPHHVANTTSWGHRPMEDALSDLRGDILALDEEDGFLPNCHRPVEIILRGYDIWQRYNVGTGGHVDVEDLVETLAYETGEWADIPAVWDDSASLEDFLGMGDPVDSYKYADYLGQTLTEFATPLEVNAAGASVAFLVDAGLVAADNTQDPTTQCTTGTVFVHGAGCVLDTDPLPPLPASGGATPTQEPEPTCKPAGMACSVNAECCAGHCSTVSGVCYVP